MAGRGSLAGLLSYGDANGIVVNMASEVPPVVKDVPVLAGVNGTDPFRIMKVFLRQLQAMGFDGVQNFPTVGLIDGNFRANLEATGMGYDKRSTRSLSPMRSTSSLRHMSSMSSSPGRWSRPAPTSSSPTRH
jgi:predicted TIM-barrel enzyme